VKASKFARTPRYGRNAEGYIGLPGARVPRDVRKKKIQKKKKKKKNKKKKKKKKKKKIIRSGCCRERPPPGMCRRLMFLQLFILGVRGLHDDRSVT